jgi:hypothetical protein
MDELLRVVESAHGTINWFAMNEAKDLAERMREATRDYRNDPNKETEQELRSTATAAMNFLKLRHSETASFDWGVLNRALRNLNKEGALT